MWIKFATANKFAYTGTVGVRVKDKHGRATSDPADDERSFDAADTIFVIWSLQIFSSQFNSKLF